MQHYGPTIGKGIDDVTIDGTAFTGESEIDAFSLGNVTIVRDLSGSLDAPRFQSVDTEGNIVIDSLAAVVKLFATLGNTQQSPGCKALFDRIFSDA